MAANNGKRRPGKATSGGKRRNAGRGTARGAHDPRAMDDLVRAVLRGAHELLDVEDPLEAEDWASGVLGVMYKPPAPLEAREHLERAFVPALVRAAERRRDATGLAVVCALAAVTTAESGAGAAATQLAARGVAPPGWADGIGNPDYLGGYAVADPFGDQVAYYLTFRYPNRPPHVVMALYDENLGGIIKDAFVAGLRPDADPRSLVEADPDVTVHDADPAEASTRIRAAIATGDLYLDNHWTDDFRRTRALILARMNLLPQTLVPESAEPLDEDAREAIIQEFLASPLAPQRPETLPIVDHCVVARCDFGDGDLLRWSPIVVELFLLDFLPRKINLSPAEIDAVPEVLTAWVRFCLGKRGLEERFIAETQEAVARYADEFREAVNDPRLFGPAKAIGQAMLADGVDVLNQNAVDAWLTDFNARPYDERSEILGFDDD